jgi:adenine-specific DNA methylase
MYRDNSYVVDLFSGSSIVSQALSNNNMAVISNDVLHFCSDIASCLLGVNKDKYSAELAIDGISALKVFELDRQFCEPFESFIEEERIRLQAKDLLGLKELYDRLPQVGKLSSMTEQIRYIREHYGDYAFNNAPFIVNYYAGTYFGIDQAIKLDCIRSFIEYFHNENQDEWVYRAMLCALYSTLSMIVHSAGKHFAQPIVIKDLDLDKITNTRLFENRGYDVYELFELYLNKILKVTKDTPIPSKNLSWCLDVETQSFRELLATKDVSVIYADPPYTAQQYSRFYHVPEAIREYRYPALQLHRGHVTQGLYPNEKFKSGFCSKSKAIKAFQTIFEMAETSGASLVISYSESQKKETGNERMVSKSDIVEMAKQTNPHYKMRRVDFAFNYRQLNSQDNIVENKEDKEFLLIFERR